MAWCNKGMHDHSEQHGHEGHVHDPSEVIGATGTPDGRSKLVVAGVANAALAATGIWVEQRTGAQPSLAEAIHNVGDVSFYLVPWLATLKNRAQPKKVLNWMRRASYGVTAIALASAAHDTYSLAADTYQHAAASSVPLQVGLTAGNIGIALFMARKPKADPANGDHSVLQAVGVRHAAYDALTSVAAVGANALAQVLPIAGPLGAAALNLVTVHGERKNLQQMRATPEAT